MFTLTDILENIYYLLIDNGLKSVYYLLMLLSLASFLYRKRQLKGRISLIIPLLICSISIEVVVDFFYWYHNKYYVFLFHLYQPLEYLLLALLYYYNIENFKIRKYILISILLYFSILITYYSYYPDYINTSRYIDFVLEAVFLSIWSIISISELINAEKIKEPITFLPMFWISFSVLLFYSGSICIMGFRYYFEQYSLILSSSLSSIHHYLNLLFYALLTTAFLCLPAKK